MQKRAKNVAFCGMESATVTIDYWQIFVSATGIRADFFYRAKFGYGRLDRIVLNKKLSYRLETGRQQRISL